MPASQFCKIIVESIALFFHSFVNTPNSQWRIVLVLTVGITAYPIIQAMDCICILRKLELNCWKRAGSLPKMLYL